MIIFHKIFKKILRKNLIDYDYKYFIIFMQYFYLYLALKKWVKIKSKPHYITLSFELNMPFFRKERANFWWIIVNSDNTHYNAHFKFFCTKKMDS